MFKCCFLSATGSGGFDNAEARREVLNQNRFTENRSTQKSNGMAKVQFKGRDGQTQYSGYETMMKIQETHEELILDGSQKRQLNLVQEERKTV